MYLDFLILGRSDGIWQSNNVSFISPFLHFLLSLPLTIIHAYTHIRT